MWYAFAVLGLRVGWTGKWGSPAQYDVQCITCNVILQKPVLFRILRVWMTRRYCNYIHLYSKRIQKNAAQLWQWHCGCDLPYVTCRRHVRAKSKLASFTKPFAAVSRPDLATGCHGIPQDGAELRGLDLDHPLSRRANFWPNPRPCGSKMDQSD